jgi:hypothetical protein
LSREKRSHKRAGSVDRGTNVLVKRKTLVGGEKAGGGGGGGGGRDTTTTTAVASASNDAPRADIGTTEAAAATAATAAAAATATGGWSARCSLTALDDRDAAELRRRIFENCIAEEQEVILTSRQDTAVVVVAAAATTAVAATAATATITAPEGSETNTRAPADNITFEGILQQHAVARKKARPHSTPAAGMVLASRSANIMGAHRTASPGEDAGEDADRKMTAKEKKQLKRAHKRHSASSISSPVGERTANKLQKAPPKRNSIATPSGRDATTAAAAATATPPPPPPPMQQQKAPQWEEYRPKYDERSRREIEADEALAQKLAELAKARGLVTVVPSSPPASAETAPLEHLTQ